MPKSKAFLHISRLSIFHGLCAIWSCLYGCFCTVAAVLHAGRLAKNIYPGLGALARLGLHGPHEGPPSASTGLRRTPPDGRVEERATELCSPQPCIMLFFHCPSYLHRARQPMPATSHGTGTRQAARGAQGCQHATRAHGVSETCSTMPIESHRRTISAL